MENIEWEYKILKGEDLFRGIPELYKTFGIDKILKNALEQLGKEGWELASQDGFGYYIFKRQKR